MRTPTVLSKSTKSHPTVVVLEIFGGFAAGRIFGAPGKEWALYASREVVARWSASHPAVTKWTEESIKDTLACFAFPEWHRWPISTTNGVERFNQEHK